MTKIKLLLSGLFIFCFINSNATTWDEPWQDKVILQADYFVLGKIETVDKEKGLTIGIIKSLSDQPLVGTIQITAFYLLDLCSSSGEGVTFDLPTADSCYFFLRKDEKGQYCIATPTAGFAYVSNGKVVATYRHSYHQALIAPDIYEKTMTAIFNNYHKLPYDTAFINSYVNKYINLQPAGFSEDELPTFFQQHAALECIYHLKLKVDEKLVVKFLNDTANFHNQVSAARALSASTNPDAVEHLLNVISDRSRNDFVKVMCIWSLEEIKPGNLKPKLKSLENSASNKENGFGGNIMDPRICTHVPTVKSALNELINKL